MSIPYLSNPAMPSWSRQTAWLTANTVIKDIARSPPPGVPLSHLVVLKACGAVDYLPERPRPDL